MPSPRVRMAALLPGVSVVALAACTPARLEPRAPHYVKATSSFDDVQAGLSLESLGLYEGLYYEGLQLANLGDEITGLIPRSQPNVLYFSTLTTATGGSGLNTPHITADRPSSAVATFNATSLFFGCATATHEPLVNLPAPCNLTARGLDGAGTVLAEQKFAYPMRVGNLRQDLRRAVFGEGFAGLTTLELSAETILTTATLATVVDDLVTVRAYGDG